MPSANKTPNYNLTQYSDNGSDKISALKDYNEDMSKIDTAINQNANNIITKADAATTYSKTDVDTKLGTKADAATTYSKTEVDSKVSTINGAIDSKPDKNSVYSKSESDSRFALIQPDKIMVWIGDSWSAQDGGQLPKDVAALQKITLKSYAVGGTGYTSATKRFSDQLVAARDDSSFDNSDVAIVVIFGGINDSSASYSNFGNAVNQTLQNAVNYFPNATRYAIGPQNGWSSQTLRTNVRNSQALRRNSVPGVVTVSDCCMWELGKTSSFVNTQPCHLSSEGHIVYAQKINSILSGVTPLINGLNFNANAYSADNVSQIDLSCYYMHPGVYQWRGFVTPKISGNVDVARFNADWPGIDGIQIPFNVYSSPAETGRVVGAFAVFGRDDTQPDIGASPAGWLGKPWKMTLVGAEAGVQYWCPWPIVSVVRPD